MLVFYQYVIWVSLFYFIRCRIYYVSQEQIDSPERTGAWSSPFLTIQDCVNALRKPGDQCQVCKGVYHEEIIMNGLHGNPGDPIVVKGYRNERPVLDGTIEIIPTTAWTNKGAGKIYRAKIPTKIWQLFLNDEMMTNARWPNAKWSDKSLFDGTIWPGVAATSKRGLIVNKGSSLAKTKINMTGAMAILNIGSFNTFVAKVKNHKAGQNSFSFDDTFGKYHFKPSRSRFFLEDKLDLLDAPEEWFYDQGSGFLHIWTPNGSSPKDFRLRGKVQSYGISITNSSHLIIRDIDFFATAIQASSSNSSFNVNNITFHSLNFKHHTYSKRMLGSTGLIEWMDVNGIFDRGRPETWGTFTFFNNTFYGSDGLALSYHGANVTIENNLFEYNDFTAANMVISGGGLGTIKSDSTGDRFIRNTLQYNGASVGIRPGLSPTVKLNNIKKQCWGLIQNDGAGVQVTRKPQVGSRLERNWVHDQPKYGLRFDGEPPKIGSNGTILQNVVGRCNGLMVKGDYHTVEGNLAFEKMNANDDDKQGAGCALCVLKYVRTNPVSINNHTVVLNNIADVANGGKIIGKKGQLYPVAGSVVKNNVFDKKITDLLMDPENNDYRPSSSKLTIGPYPYKEKMKTYWIPGRKLYKASIPVPPDGSTTVNPLKRDALMWLNGYNSYKHKVYFGKADEEKNLRTEDALKYAGTVKGNVNVIYLREKVEKQQKYYWRVDAVARNKRGEEIIYKGDIWSFVTLP